ncbi:MAG TPA: Hsp20/alpha crystallin family protein [Candidatus Pacearchaeota archaeon]|nr:Hsp20/alpha crystallin family protein [Candidatus Parcubacteria bacterium]HNZ84042.1 Hsp20/alpha crystallin family protein [Candidatus Pacearchaeota archaeon]
MKIIKNKEDLLKQDEYSAELSLDIYETDDELIVQSPIAGVKKQDLDVYVDKGMLVINGQRSEKTEESKKNYIYQECYWGKFSRRVILPAEIDETKIEASLKDGLLTIKFPKSKKSEQTEDKIQIDNIKEE